MRDEVKKQIILISNDIRSSGINVYSSYYNKNTRNFVSIW